MAFRAFLFSSDSTASAQLCQILTDLGIEAEICGEMLAAVERITKEAFDAVIVDWDHQTEAMFLIKSLRDLKSAAHVLTLALVQNDADLPAALQAGANSAIRKPIDSRQAHDTLSTARQLIEARQREEKTKETRLAPAPIPTGPDEADMYGHDDEGRSSPKPGFIQQTAPRSALEAIESVAPEPHEEPAPAPPPPPDPEVRARALAILGYGPKAEPAKPAAERPSPKVIDFSGNDSSVPRDAAGVFSSLPESNDSEETPADSPRPKYGVYAVAVLVLVGGVLWVFAPGDSYFSRLKRFELQHSRPAPPAGKPNLPQAVPAPQNPEPAPAASKSLPPVEPDPEITNAQDDASASIQVIENKPIPPPGAQQPPTPDPPPTLATGQSPIASQAEQSPAPPPAAPDASPTSQPLIQSISASPSSPAPAASAPTDDDAAPAAQSSSTQATVPQATAPSTPAAPSHVPDEGISANVDGHAGVIIPDSLKTRPAPAPASSLDPPSIPEETSRALVVRRVDPQYPPQALQQRLDGPVVLQVRVGKDGSIRDLKLVKGYFLLGRAAYDAVRQWRFKPYTPNGKPVEFQTNVTITFKYPG